MAPDAGPITATSNLLVHLLGGGPARVSLDGGRVRFSDAEGTPTGAIDQIETRRSWFWTRLTIRAAGGAERSIGGLDREEADRRAEAVRADSARSGWRRSRSPSSGHVTSRLLANRATGGGNPLPAPPSTRSRYPSAVSDPAECRGPTPAAPAYMIRPLCHPQDPHLMARGSRSFPNLAVSHALSRPP